MIFAGGIIASRVSVNLDLEKNKKGQVIVNEYLQAKNHNNIFAIGDIAEIKNKKGEIMPPNVTIARESGIRAGRNILRKIKKRKLKKCDPKLEGILIALGGKYAVGNLYGLVHVKGLLAYIIKRYVFRSYRNPLLDLIKIGYKKLKKRTFN